MTVEPRPKVRYDAGDRPASIQAEPHLERLKYRGDLRLEYLKRIYDRSPIFQRYVSGKACIHLHGLWHTHARFWEHKEVVGVCIRLSPHFARDAHMLSAQVGIPTMLVRVGQFFEQPQTVMSLIRLQLLDECVVFDWDSFKIPLNTSPEVIWTLTDRELRAAFRAGRLPAPDFRSCMNELIENSFKLTRYSPNFRAYILKRIRNVLADNVGVPWMTICGNAIQLEIPAALNQLLKIRQAFPSVL